MVGVSEGTSPRERGQRKKPIRANVDSGNIPARAGTTITVSRALSISPEHPRASGDNT
ncbi:Uncharacterised protein [Corynebacterium kutscheri]|nr:Uncharacterised protein [Corynebacterium kutscheri]